MNSYGSNIILGTISCLAETTHFLEDRVKMHKRQVEFLEGITATMHEKYDASPLPYFRVQQGWNEERETTLATPLLTEAIKFDTPIPPGAARNELLKRLYESDADWLVCMDDDHALYEKFNGYELLWELDKPAFMKLAHQGYMIMSFPAYWDGYMKEINAWGHQDTHWLLKRTRHPGAMPFACIPNIVKYGMKPVWFDDKTAASKAGEIPEDLRFMIDWIGNGGRWAECINMLGKSCGSMDKSSIFDEKDTRLLKYEADRKWTEFYLKQKYPRNPALWSKRNFLARKNPQFSLELPRHFTKEASHDT